MALVEIFDEIHLSRGDEDDFHSVPLYYMMNGKNRSDASYKGQSSGPSNPNTTEIMLERFGTHSRNAAMALAFGELIRDIREETLLSAMRRDVDVPVPKSFSSTARREPDVPTSVLISERSLAVKGFAEALRMYRKIAGERRVIQSDLHETVARAYAENYVKARKSPIAFILARMTREPRITRMPNGVPLIVALCNEMMCTDGVFWLVLTSTPIEHLSMSCESLDFTGRGTPRDEENQYIPRRFVTAQSALPAYLLIHMLSVVNERMHERWTQFIEKADRIYFVGPHLLDWPRSTLIAQLYVWARKQKAPGAKKALFWKFIVRSIASSSVKAVKGIIEARNR